MWPTALNEFDTSDLKQLSSLRVIWQKERNNDLVFACLQIAHVVMKRKRPYTELESVVFPCHEIAADTLHEGKKAMARVRQIPFSVSITRDVEAVTFQTLPLPLPPLPLPLTKNEKTTVDNFF